MISMSFVAGVAYDSLADEPVVTVALPATAPPTATTEYVFLAWFAGRSGSNWSPAGMTAAASYPGSGLAQAAVLWTRIDLDLFNLAGSPAPLVLTRLAVGHVDVADQFAYGISVRIVAYAITKSAPVGFTSVPLYTLDAYESGVFSVVTVDGTHEFSGLAHPTSLPIGTPFTEADMWPGSTDPLVRHYALSLLTMAAPPFWRGGFSDPDDINPYYDDVPSVGAAFDDPLPAGGQGALTRRYDPEQPYTRQALWDSLGGLQPGSWSLDNDVVMRTPTVTNFNTVTFGAVARGAHPFDMQYEPVVFTGHLKVAETLVADDPPPVEGECPDNLPAMVSPGPVRVRTDDPVIISLARRGREPVGVLAAPRS